MYGKKFEEINTKQKIKYQKNKSYSLARIFCEKEYSLFKLVLLDDNSISIKEKNLLLITETSNKIISSEYMKKSQIFLNKSISKIYYVCFQQKKIALNIMNFY